MFYSQFIGSHNSTMRWAVSRWTLLSMSAAAERKQLIQHTCMCSEYRHDNPRVPECWRKKKDFPQDNIFIFPKPNHSTANCPAVSSDRRLALFLWSTVTNFLLSHKYCKPCYMQVALSSDRKYRFKCIKHINHLLPTEWQNTLDHYKWTKAAV